MANQREDLSINRHFKREGIIPALVTVVMIGVTLVMALAGPWLFGFLR